MEMRNFEKFFVNSIFCNFFNKGLILPTLFRFINKNLAGEALEIGCGIGETTKLLAKKYAKLMITAIDYDEEQIQRAKKNKALKNKNLNRAIFQQGDATQLKFKNSSFDHAIEINTFHHIEDYSKAIKEAYRALKKNGSFYMVDFSKYAFFWPIRLFFPPESLFTKEELVKNLENTGFKIEKSSGRLLLYIIARKV